MCLHNANTRYHLGYQLVCLAKGARNSASCSVHTALLLSHPSPLPSSTGDAVFTFNQGVVVAKCTHPLGNVLLLRYVSFVIDELRHGRCDFEDRASWTGANAFRGCIKAEGRGGGKVIPCRSHYWQQTKKKQWERSSLSFYE